MIRATVNAASFNLEMDGLEVCLYRSSIDGRLVVDIDSGCVAGSDEHESGVPRLVVYINEQRGELRADGSWCEVT